MPTFDPISLNRNHPFPALQIYNSAHNSVVARAALCYKINLNTERSSCRNLGSNQ
ncbi:unnamed protein product, partial [Nesidiocoris tenuis]